MTENEAISIQIILDLKNLKDNLSYESRHYTTEEQSLDMAIQALEEIQQYRAYKEIFESHFSKDALELLSDKEEFGKWLERGKWIAKKCDEINRELEQYRAIGTVEEFKELKEKTIAKKVINRNSIYRCPTCESLVSVTQTKCTKCSQKLDWE